MVGGDSARSVLADRLSEGGHSRVLLLEAGRDWRSAEAPAGIRSLNFFHAFGRPDFFWQDLKRPADGGEKTRAVLRWTGPGGGSTVNALFYVRPPPLRLRQVGSA